jgi:ubiquinone/menaquinone biosynthesis C-methylase UbiE
MRCAPVCPFFAIDKADVLRQGESVVCACCGRRYPVEDGVFVMHVEYGAGEKEVFDYYAEGEYEDHHGQCLDEDAQWKPKKVLGFLPAGPKYRTLLDLGCGPGVVSRAISESTGTDRIIFMDLSPIPLKPLAAEGAGLCIAADAGYLPLHNGAADLTLMLDLLEHVPDAARVLLEQARASGSILVKSPLEKAMLRNGLHTVLNLIYGDSYWKRIFGHIQRFDRGSLRGLIASAGFVPEKELLSIDFASSIKSPVFRLFLLTQQVSYSVMPSAIFEALFGGHLWILAKRRDKSIQPNESEPED